MSESKKLAVYEHSNPKLRVLIDSYWQAKNTDTQNQILKQIENLEGNYQETGNYIFIP